MVQAVIVMVLFDVIFGSFVAAHHPFLKVEGRGALDAQPDMGRSSLGSLPAAAQITASFATDPSDLSPARLDNAKKPMTVASAPFVTVAGRQIDPESLILLKIEDHYLRIETEGQSFLERYKFRDAVAEIGTDLGVQINRSTWVAGAQIASFNRCGPQTLAVTLKTGDEFSVSRSRQAAVTAACDRWNIQPETKH